ncbi:MAG: multidrug effflux MFS transporter [Caulobacteraceae bacterium]
MSSRFRIRPETAAFTLFLGALAAFGPIAIDLAQPAITPIARALHAAPNAVTLGLSFFLAGSTAGPLVFGPMSDRYGRRPVIMIGCLLYALASVGCAFAPSAGVFLALRLAQGAASGAGSVASLAMVRDLFKGDLARARLSYVSLVSTIAPMVAPALGVWILAAGGWRATFGSMAGLGLALLLTAALLLSESLPAKGRAERRGGSILTAFAQPLKSPVFVGYALTQGLSFGALMAFIAISPLMLMENLGASRALYAVLFAAIVVMSMAGGYLSGRLASRGAAAEKILTAALLAAAAVDLLLLALALLGLASLWTVVPLLMLAFMATSMVGPNATHGALEGSRGQAGVSAAVFGFLQTACGALVAAVASMIFDGRTAVPIAAVMAASAAAAALAYFVWVRPRERAAARA